MNKIDTILFIGDNSDTANFGCRATSTALANVLSKSKSVIITDRFFRGKIRNLFPNTPLCEDWQQYLSTIKLHSRFDYDNLISRINKVDAVVLNGEGSFIFQSPPRYDLHNYLVILQTCIEMNKPFYVLNFMFTAYADEPMNTMLMEQTLGILEHAKIVCVRDLESKRLIESKNKKITVHYLPDALFSWHSLFVGNEEILKNIIANSHFVLPFSERQSFYRGLDFTRPYVLFSGNSYASHHFDKAEKSFTDLALVLKNKAEILGYKLYLIECCNGDHVLRNVAVKLDLPLIPVTINIYLAMYILGNAKCFISGRYHPSIMASLGGTPCVFMGSNSHKTSSLQSVLEIPNDEQATFSAIPNEEEILKIVAAFEKTVKNANRNRIKATCEKNAILVNCGIGKLVKENSL